MWRLASLALCLSIATQLSAQTSLSKTYLVVTDQTSNNILRFETNGDLKDTFVQFGPTAPVSAPESVVFGLDQNLYVSSFGTGSVERYNGSTGQYVGRFAPTASSPLRFAQGIKFGPDGNLYVVDRVRSAIVRFDGGTGTFIDDFVKAGDGGYNNPSGITFGPDGNLYATSGTQSFSGPATTNPQILRFDGKTGAFKDVFVATNSGGLSSGYTLLFGPDGNLYVSNVLTNSVLRYNGKTGAFIDAFVAAGSGGLTRPTGMTFGPDGLFYVASSFGFVGILRYNATTGAFIDDFIPAGRGGMAGPTDILFYTFESQLVPTGTDPSVATDPAGNRVVVWDDDNVVNVQPFDPNGKSTAPVRTISPSNETASKPQVTFVGNNLFMVAWQVQSAQGSRVRVQPVPLSGTPPALPPPISTPPAGFGDVTPAITALGNGRAGVVWSRSDSAGRGRGLLGRVVDANGSVVAGEVQLSTTVQSSDEFPSISSDKNGHAIVTWRRRRDDGTSTRIIAGPTDGSLAPTFTSAFVIDDGTTGAVGEPVTAANNFGNAVIAWPRASTEASRALVQAFTMNITPIGKAATINADVKRTVTKPAVGIDAAGNITATWQYQGLSGGTGIYGRSVDLAGNFLDKADIVIADAANATEQFGAPSVAVSPNGTATVTTGRTNTGTVPLFTASSVTRAIVSRVELPGPGRTSQNGCTQNASTLCLSNQRFAVSATWRTNDGSFGDGQANVLTSDTGYFTFFSGSNVEVVVKVLAACGVNSRFWVFAGGLTNVNVTLTVRDTATGAVRTYTNPLNTPFQPIQDTDAFATCSAEVPAAIQAEGEPVRLQTTSWSEPSRLPEWATGALATCTPTATTICLSGDRYGVSATWRTNDGASGDGQAVRITPDTGYFTFFNAANVEVIVKVLNACSISSKYWVFAGGLTNVNVVLTVRDYNTGAVRTYTNPANTKFQPIQDTSAFSTCP